MKLLLGILLSYLIGSIPTAFLVSKQVCGVDIRKSGSGNVGATNVFRVVGKKWGIGVLILDILKGFFAVTFISRFFLSDFVSPFVSSLLFGLAAIGGHTWTVWLGFKGGKGVATSLGVLLALIPAAAGAGLAVWLLIFTWKRYVSLASLVMAASLPFWVFLFYKNAAYFHFLFPISLGLTLFLFYTHRSNIQRLRQGTEKQLI